MARFVGGSGVIGLTKDFDGEYELTFARHVDNCAIVVSLSDVSAPTKGLARWWYSTFPTACFQEWPRSWSCKYQFIAHQTARVGPCHESEPIVGSAARGDWGMGDLPHALSDGRESVTSAIVSC